jgi:hypothetical protein
MCWPVWSSRTGPSPRPVAHQENKTVAGHRRALSVLMGEQVNARLTVQLQAHEPCASHPPHQVTCTAKPPSSPSTQAWWPRPSNCRSTFPRLLSQAWLRRSLPSVRPCDWRPTARRWTAPMPMLHRTVCLLPDIVSSDVALLHFRQARGGRWRPMRAGDAVHGRRAQPLAHNPPDVRIRSRPRGGGRPGLPVPGRLSFFPRSLVPRRSGGTQPS